MIVTLRRTKAWISISKEKGECPLHAPLTPVYSTCYPGNPMGRMQIRGTNAAPPCLPSQFTLMMTNTFVHGEGRWEFQCASNHCPPEISPVLSSHPPFILILKLRLLTHLFINVTVLPLGDDSSLTHSTCSGGWERSVLSKQTYWAICYSTLHQPGSSEESAHHFNQTWQHTMNL